MRDLPLDISEEMKIRFKADFDTAMKILQDYLSQTEELTTDRMIRCMIYLSKNGVTSLKQTIDAAKKDPRDVLFWAEYENHNAEFPKRIRDFTNNFSENDL